MIACLQAAQWLAGRAAGLTSAQALRLEDHLSECGACRDELRALDALREELDASVEPLPVVQRARIVEQALAAATAQSVPVIRERRLLPLTAGLAAAAAVGLYLAPPAATPVTSSAARGAANERAGTAPSAQAAQSPGLEQTIEAQAEPRPVTVGRARVVLGAHSRMRLGRDGSVTLDRGRLEVELAQAPGGQSAQGAEAAPFEVRTERFDVTVLAARFVTEPETVQVLSGQVRIVAPDGAALVERVGAGERWSVSGAEPEATVVGRVGAREHPRPEHTARLAGHAAATDAQLAQARAWLAERRVPEARATIEGVLRSGPSRSARAEALSLAAECALVEQHYEQAVAAYLQVAAQHPRLGAGQNALFAAARIRAQQGQSTEARALLRRYLDRYPAGRFRDEAERRLAQLDAPAAP